MTSPVPIKCDLELQKELNITESFAPEDKIQGEDKCWTFKLQIRIEQITVYDVYNTI